MSTLTNNKKEKSQQKPKPNQQKKIIQKWKINYENIFILIK